MKYCKLHTIGLILTVLLAGACVPSEGDGDRYTRDAASGPDADTGVDTGVDRGDVTEDTGPAAVAAVTISPADPTIQLNRSLKLEATAVDADGNEVQGRAVSWSSSSAETVSVNEYANVLGLAVGAATITATIEDVSSSTVVTVEGPPVDTVRVVPAQRTLQIGEQVELSVFLEDINGVPIDDERDIQFSSSAPGVATVSADGLVTGASAGSATITAASEGQSDTAAITVEASTTTIERVEVTPTSTRLIRGDTTQLQVAVYEAGDSEVIDPSVTWTSSAPSVAEVDPTGRVEAIGEGSATIIASSGGKSDTVAVDVTFSLEVLARGGSHGCGLIEGVAFCWGSNDRGQLGRGTTAASEPVGRVAGAYTFASLALGDTHTCALTASGAAYCWGANDAGRLGDGTAAERHIPTQVQGGHTFTDIAAGSRHTCAVDAQGTIWCWGANGFGQLGDGSTTGSNVPVQVSGPGLAKVFAVNSHTCGIGSSGNTYCWGRNHRGQLGVDDTVDRHTPAQVTGGYDFSALTLGQSHTCGLTTGGIAACWGANDVGQVGDGTTDERRTPILVSGSASFSRLSAGHRHTCGLAPGGRVYCWGTDSAGQLGLGSGSTGDKQRPTEVSTVATFSDVHSGGDSACGLDVAGKPLCWGAPSGNQSPTPVAGF
jgi:alpha-tubulin suppressor-like RCC1 family protein/uncharacterized protein YjdB